MEQQIRSPQSLKGEIAPPPDKSVSHRSLIINSLAEGVARVSNFLTSADCLATLSCLKSLGVSIERNGSEVIITGRGIRGFQQPDGLLDARNSGTTMRLMTGLLASQPFTCTITGDESLRSRPMGRVIEPLNLMGAKIESCGNRAPLTITGGSLHGIHYKLTVASAQVKSAILLAALTAEGQTVIEQPAPSRDHTERMLQAMGASVRIDDLNITLIGGGSPLKPLDMKIPGDISSAAFWMVAGVVHPHARIRLTNVGINPTRTGILEVLQSMNASIIIESQRLEGNEPVADLLIQSSKLRGIEIGGEVIPRLIDEIPAIAVAASQAEGTTVIRDAAELRVKESDRIHTTATELSRMGARIDEREDGMIIQGGTKLHGNRCNSHGDHRLAMTLAVAGLIAEGETVVDNSEAVEISYPEFWSEIKAFSGKS